MNAISRLIAILQISVAVFFLYAQAFADSPAPPRDYMNRLSNLLLTLLVVSCISCATFLPATNEQNGRPNDFGVEYKWREGSLPPPYHYEYTIIIKPSGQSKIVLIPDYPAADVPKWAEDFKVTEKDLNALYRVMVANGLFTQKWQQLDAAPVGGSNQILVVTAQGKLIKVEDYLVFEQQAPAKAMYAAVQALVPKEIWGRLQAKRHQYIQEYPRR